MKDEAYYKGQYKEVTLLIKYYQKSIQYGNIPQEQINIYQLTISHLLSKQRQLAEILED